MVQCTQHANRWMTPLQEYTNYHFDVKPNALHGALDRFAQFFIDPLCKADALEREVMAVDNEFSGTVSSLCNHTQRKRFSVQEQCNWSSCILTAMAPLSKDTLI